MIVDLGCGPGNITEKIACIWSNAKVLGVDDINFTNDLN